MLSFISRFIAAATICAVIACPSWKVTPGRRVSSHFVAVFCCGALARRNGTAWPWSSVWVSVSAKENTASMPLAGSSELGRNTAAIFSVGRAPLAAPAEVEVAHAAKSVPAAVATAAAPNSRPRLPVLFPAMCDSCLRWAD